MAPEASRKPRTTILLQGKGRHFDKLRKDLLAVQADAGGEDVLRLRIRQTGKKQAMGAI